MTEQTSRELDGSASGQRTEPEELTAAVRLLAATIQQSNREMARLASAIEAALAKLSTEAVARGEALTLVTGAPFRINWVIGPPENAEWAYGNNARRLAGKLRQYAHSIGSDEPSDVAVYFDPLVAQSYRVQARKSVLRIGGPRPLKRVCGEDAASLRRFLEPFDAVVVLNSELYLRILRLHGNVHLVPNALDLAAWPLVEADRKRPFTAGFAASLTSSSEADIKGLHIAKAAAARAGVELILASRNDGQVPHDRMHSDFYSQIDVLVHPVAAGREGTSNVIMEALAAGVPVVTTVDAGFHGEFLVDGRSGLIREREERAFAEAISLLERDPGLRARLRKEGSAFARRHHDLNRASLLYGQIFRDVLEPRARHAEPRRVAFVPYWEPVERFGSSRLRAKYPTELLSGTTGIDVRLGYSEDAEVVVVVQMCSDDVLAKLRANDQQYVVYDVCDKYYENPRVFKHVDPPVSSFERFGELIERADLVTVPSRELKAEIASRFPDKPVKYLPEPVDYGASARAVSAARTKTVLWFGNPDRGNFSSARWMIERLRDQHGYTPLIVSRAGFFGELPELRKYVRDWSPDAMIEAFREADLCVLACSAEETAKSANRFIAAVMHGVPTLVIDDWPACSEILDAVNHRFAALENESDLDRAVQKLEDAEFRARFVVDLQNHIGASHGPSAIRDTYAELFRSAVFPKQAFDKRRRVAFVCHNMAMGEGAPWSLFELVQGLATRGVEPFVFACGTGSLAQEYRRAGLRVETFEAEPRHAVKVLNGRFEATRKAFQDFLRANRIEAVICNTVKSAPFAAWARELGLPATVIVRESFEAEARFSHFIGDARLSAIHGLTNASNVVFVSQATREHWLDQHFKGDVRVIPNGISRARFKPLDRVTKSEARSALELPEDSVVALSVGSINTRKGQHELAQAFAALPLRVRERAHLLFLGASESKRSEEFLESLRNLPASVREHILVFNVTRDAGLFYKASDLFVMNSKSEAYPRSVVEALHFGLPVLSTPVFGVREQVEHGRSGYLYEHEDWASFGEHFEQLVLNREARERMARHAQRSFYKLTGYEEMLLEYKSLLGRMLEQEPPKATLAAPPAQQAEEHVERSQPTPREVKPPTNGGAHAYSNGNRVAVPPNTSSVKRIAVPKAKAGAAKSNKPVWQRKLAKLRRDPRRFVADSRVPALKLVARVLRIEPGE